MLLKSVVALLLSQIITGKLIQVISMFRHGARDPMVPLGSGLLTNYGKIQQYLLGRQFKENYQEFLSEQYSADEVNFLTDDQSRCNLSANFQLSGLYPSEDQQEISIDSSYISLPPYPIQKDIIEEVKQNGSIRLGSPAIENVRKVEFNNNYYFGAPWVCPYMLDIQNAYKDDPAYLTFQQKQFFVFKTAAKLFNEKYNTSYNIFEPNLEDLDSMLDVYISAKFNNEPYPDWPQKLYDQVFHIIAERRVHWQFRNITLQKGAVTYVFREWVNITKNVINNQEVERKYSAYSGHDTNLMLVLQLLMDYKMFWALRDYTVLMSFASNLFFEFHQYENKQITVTMKFQDRILPMKGGCLMQDECNVEEFLKLLEEGIFEDFELVCPDL